VSRLQPVPAYLASAVNLHLVSDVHCQEDSWARARIGKVLDDADRMVGRHTIDAHLVMGDLTNTALPAEASLWAAWRDGLASGGAQRPVHAVLGNHDLNQLTPDQAAALLGLPAANYIQDVGDVRLIALALTVLPIGNSARMVVPPEALAFLDAQLGATTRPCLVLFHAPLAETVGVGDLATSFTSEEDWVKAHSDPAGGDGVLRQILAAHPNAVAWISGHTHSPISTPGLVTTVDLGSHRIAAVNASGLWYTGRSIEAHDPLCGLLLSVLDEHTFEVRFRDHGAGVWTAPTGAENAGRKVVTLTV